MAPAPPFRLGPWRVEPALRLTPLTATPGLEYDPALSPDGNLSLAAGPDSRWLLWSQTEPGQVETDLMLVEGLRGTRR